MNPLPKSLTPLPRAAPALSGLWPAAWLMGNLARATFAPTTTNVWPWSYNKCGEIDHLGTKQLINACDGSPGYDFNPYQGRGAPEIDIFEVMPGHNMPGFDQQVKPFMSSSLQISPGVPKGPQRQVNGLKLNTSKLWFAIQSMNVSCCYQHLNCVCLRYDGLRVGEGGDLNYWFWGQECGQEFDYTAEKIHKYMEDAISINTCEGDLLSSAEASC